ncbi:MAG: hypothetical protein ACJ786_15835 [Catenulispora sp.]
MGIYVSVRGWLECDQQQLAAIHTITTAHDDGYYSGGWTTPSQPSWTYYVFFGSDMRESALDGFLEQVRLIAQIPASDADDDRVTGLFFATHEINGMSEWQIRDGKVFVTPGDGRYGYLDA